jgi:ribosomal protein S18 acetylase RimI-like enzyme
MPRDWMLMRCPLASPPPPADWPGSYRLSDLGWGGSEEFYGLLAEVYEGDPGLLPYDSWWTGVSQDPEFDASLCFYLQGSDGKVAAVALNWTSGFVKDLAVSPVHRRKGLGRALLRHSLEVFRGRGIISAALKVQKDNPHKAWRLYESLGFRAEDAD